jgi:hypothetical protein
VHKVLAGRGSRGIHLVAGPVLCAPTQASKPVQVTDQKIAMEILLADLGISAKSNFLHIKRLFDGIDKDHSGQVDGDELASALQPHSVCCPLMAMCGSHWLHAQTLSMVNCLLYALRRVNV